MVTHTSLSLLPAFLILMRSLESVTPSSNASSCFVSERNALLNFKHSLIDPSNRLSSWVGHKCCDWPGIHSNKPTGHVQLNLRNPFDYDNDDWEKYESHCLGGELHISLQNLKHLTHLDLSLNNFFTNISDFFRSFTNLRYLNLSNSYFTGKVTQMPTSLQYLDLSSNNYGLQNKSLWWVSHLFSLKHLDLSGVYLSNATDWFPPINMLPSLLVLKLRGCKLDLSSNIPSNINFASRVSLDLSDNSYLKPNVNIAFRWLYNPTNLVELNLHGNFHGGPIPGSTH